LRREFISRRNSHEKYLERIQKKKNVEVCNPTISSDSCDSDIGQYVGLRDLRGASNGSSEINLWQGLLPSCGRS
jgi:hypothetical protein